MKQIISDILNFLFPRRCVMCGNRLTASEKSICASCYIHLPYTNYHTVEHSPLEKIFWKQFPIERATSIFYYGGNETRRIIHLLKYKSRPEVGYNLALTYAKELEEYRFFENIDCIIPIPLHWKRQMKRHYNQCFYVAKGISKVTGIPIYNNVIKRVVNNPTQTRLKRFERGNNVDGIFLLKDKQKIEGKHILLVDDVTTTGSTIMSCAKELSKASNIKISVFTLAKVSKVPIPVSKEECADASVYGLPLMESHS